MTSLEPATTPFADRDEFIEQYRRLCGHIARRFVQRWKYKIESVGHTIDDSCKWETKTPQFTNSVLIVWSQDLAAAALLRLTKCPEKYWDQPHYVKRIIVNAIIDEQKVQQRVFENEWQAPDLANRNEINHYQDWFDTQPGRDGLADATRIKHDTQKILSILPSLSQGERLVIEFYFGVNGVKSLSEYAIASKLGRTRFWVQRRLFSGLQKIRKQVAPHSPLKNFPA